MTILRSTFSDLPVLPLEPFINLIYGFWAHIQLNRSENILNFINNSHNIESLKKVDSVALDKINGFIAELNLHSGEISVRENNAIPGMSATIPCMSAIGSLRIGAIAAISVTPATIAEIQTDFTLEHKFVIAHEIGHLIYDDVGTGFLQDVFNGHRKALIYFTISCFVFRFFCNSNLFNYSVSCVIAKFIRVHTLRNQIHMRELRADRWSAQQSKGLAQGGIEFLKRHKRDTCESYNKQIEANIVQASIYPLIFDKIVLVAETYLLKLNLYLYDKLNWHQHTHPNPTKRMTELSKV